MSLLRTKVGEKPLTSCIPSPSTAGMQCQRHPNSLLLGLASPPSVIIRGRNSSGTQGMMLHLVDSAGYFPGCFLTPREERMEVEEEVVGEGPLGSTFPTDGKQGVSLW